MKDFDKNDLSWDEWDELVRPAPQETDFDRIIDEAVSRRGFLGGLIAFGSGAAAMGLMNTGSAQAQSAGRFPFRPIPIATDHAVHVPEGYSMQVVARWGDPLMSGVGAFDPATGMSSADQEMAFGENTDGMEVFDVDGRNVIAINHEYVNTKINLPQSEGETTSAEDVLRLQNAQGITVMEVAQGDDGWSIVIDSPYNRRITHNTPMRIAGPAAGHDLLKTQADPDGVLALGTMNNCGAGRTPWGTYLTCEENFNGYFGAADAEMDLPEGFARYGVSTESRYGYEKFDPRFDLAQNPNEPHRFGYVVEIDPSNANSTPVKRTALGRIKHENAAFALSAAGNPVIYMGDDERGEYVYKFVSAGVYEEGGPTDGLLDEGQLYVARFDVDGTGEWLALTPEATGMADDAMIAIHTRMAASAVKGTTMDRPEWVAVNPTAAEVYCCLTNNSKRAADFTNAGGDPVVPVEGSPNPRAENRYGQIVRWYPLGGDHGATAFTWDLYVMAGNPVVHNDANAGSANINAGNLFNSPDGMVFDSTGLVWIQTDGNDSNEEGFIGMGNNQMLVGDPVTGEIERFLTGPKGSEVTGLTFSLDRKTAFVGIQHPGGTWPDGSGVPRSSVIAVTRDDGGVIG